jgi:CDGSH-type Zn-finger protein
MPAKKRSPGRGRKIKVTKDGPYIVSGGIPLAKQTIGIDSNGFSHEWREGDNYPCGDSCALCRCGHSKNKPFCDGTHVKVKFDGTETASRDAYLDQARTIRGPTLALTDVEALCAAARFCDRAGGVWSLVTNSGSPQARRIAIEEAVNCPSGRLVVWGSDGKAIEPKFQRSIAVVEDPNENMNGPIWVRGGILIESADGGTYEIRNRVALCRCGKSSNKPFCDGSHCK